MARELHTSVSTVTGWRIGEARTGFHHGADAVPEQLEEAGERVAEVLRKASGSNLLAVPKPVDRK
jgi:hypothetical protein